MKLSGAVRLAIVASVLGLGLVATPPLSALTELPSVDGLPDRSAAELNRPWFLSGEGRRQPMAASTSVTVPPVAFVRRVTGDVDGVLRTPVLLTREGVSGNASVEPLHSCVIRLRTGVVGWLICPDSVGCRVVVRLSDGNQYSTTIGPNDRTGGQRRCRRA